MLDKLNKAKQNQMIKMILLAGVVLLIVLYFPDVINKTRALLAVFYPLLIGAIIAFILNILMSGYEKIYFPASQNRFVNGSRRGICLLLAMLTIVLIVYIVLRIIIPQIAHTIYLISAGFPDMYAHALNWAKQYSDEVPGLQQKLAALDVDGAAIVKKAMALFGSWAFGTVSVIGSVFGKIVNFVLALVFSIYILFDKENLKVQFDKLCRAYMRPRRREKLYDGLSLTNRIFSDYIIGQCKEAFILGALCAIGMLIFGFPYALSVGSVVGLTALIPVVGTFIGAAIGVLLIVIVDPVKALLFIVFIIVLQQLEGNLIYPRVVGDSVGLPGIWVLAAITVGGGLMGITGVLLGVPVAATIYKLLGMAVNARLDKECPIVEESI
ncbi:MAG TPA: AI-2E family transporter [Syntrophomonas sp.]|nr:AI-2E family transporter [Syntrophomonas sp.]